LLTKDRYLISGFHKRFMAVAKLVDLLIEPLVHSDGIDLYERGGNVALANMLNICIPAFLGRTLFDLLVNHFVEMIRRPSHQGIENFYSLLIRMTEKNRQEDFAADLALILATREIAEAYKDRWDGSDLDPAIPALVEHASIWTARLCEPFRLIHDNSHPIAGEQLILEALMSETEERVEIGYDRRKSVFPIAAREIELHDSADWPQLQVADILASAAAYKLRAIIRDEMGEFCVRLSDTNVLSEPHRAIWPSTKVTPQELGMTEVGGIDAADYMGDYMAKRLGGIPPQGQRRKGARQSEGR
jgi:hypothetical protein